MIILIDFLIFISIIVYNSLNRHYQQMWTCEHFIICWRLLLSFLAYNFHFEDSYQELMHNIDYCLMSLYYIEKMYICNLLRNRTDIQKRQSFLVKATSIVGDRCNKCFVSSVMTLEYCRSFISFFNFILTYIFITI